MLATWLASVFLLCGLAHAASEGKDERYTYNQMCKVDGKLTVLNGFDCREQVAVAKWRNSVNVSGWTFLEVETQAKFDPVLQAYAAGYLEGVLSRQVLHYHIQNTAEDYCKNFTQYCKRMTEFVGQNQDYIKKKLQTTSRDDMYWLMNVRHSGSVCSRDTSMSFVMVCMWSIVLNPLRNPVCSHGSPSSSGLLIPDHSSEQLVDYGQQADRAIVANVVHE
ncbi:unnamed protein product [Heligmosomoides polygyrus]|uniref:Phospholipase B-like n=1 Tax=Heligmosomoides polygyrus TaxID=6339 RepID=A0A183F5P3_HELPZ|nr:unnamed protein product [Heligmosomoides polygyrus]